MCIKRESGPKLAKANKDIRKEETLPYRQIIPLMLVQFSQAVQVMMLFPMLVFMVEFYGIAGNNHKAIGKYSGLLASVFPFTMLITSFFWGWVSDRIGRKPVALMSVYIMGISSIALGFCTDYYTALAIRAGCGIFNNLTSMLKCMMSELAPKSQQAKAMSMFAVAWTSGTLMGPSIAGMLTMPCEQYKNMLHCSEDHLLARFPFLLPFGFFGVVTLLSAVVATVIVPETLAKKTVDIHRLMSFRSIYVSDSQPKKKTLARRLSQLFVFTKKDEKYQSLEMTESSDMENGSMGNVIKVDDKEGEKEAEETEREGLLQPGALKSSNESKSWFRSTDIQISVFLYCFVALFFVTYEELYPLFGSSKTELGGLGLASKDIGILMSIGGGATIPYSLFFYPKMVNKYGALALMRVGGLVCFILSLSTPFFRMVQFNSYLLFVTMALSTIVLHINAANIFSSSILLVNTTSPPESMGSVNSYGQALASFARVIGPATVGALWTVCGHIPNKMLEVTVPFFFPAMSAVLLLILAFIAPERINAYS